MVFGDALGPALAVVSTCLLATFYVPFLMAEELNGFPLFDVRGHTPLFVKASPAGRHPARTG